MEKEILIMFKRVTLFDLIIAVIGTIIICFNWIVYLDKFLLGLLLACINFIFSGIVLRSVVCNSKSILKSLNMILFAVRILLISLTGYLVYKNNSYNVISYMAGFCSHFLSLIAYGISVKDN